MSGSPFDIRRAFGSGSSDCWSCVGVQPIVTSDRTQLPLMMAVGVGRGYDLRVLTGGAPLWRDVTCLAHAGDWISLDCIQSRACAHDRGVGNLLSPVMTSAYL